MNEIKKNTYLIRDDWSSDVKEALNKLIDKYKNTNSYVVFDFDNTCSIFDTCEQMVIYQLENMRFKLDPYDLKEVLESDIKDLNKDLSYTGLIKGSFNDLILDIVNAYQVLWDKYEGLTNINYDELKDNLYYQEFVTKMRYMYNVVEEVESSFVAYPWLLYWFTNMTRREVYDLAIESFEKYSKVKTSLETLISPKELKSNVGQIAVNYYCGLGVTENIKELLKAFKDNNIDVYVCSASHVDVVRAAIDYFGLHDLVKGLIGMTIKYENEIFLNEYDYESGYGYYALENNIWKKMEYPTKAEIVGEGKATSIKNVLYPIYGKGPIAGFMDSSGDFNFCTEFKSLDTVVCFNKCRKASDGGGLIAEIAMYQKEVGYKDEDTHYYLQGRDENGFRSFRNSNSSIRLNETGEVLFRNKDNYEVLEYMLANKKSVKEYINELNKLKDFKEYHIYD